MASGFAGAQRAGERLRRRLASESEETPAAPLRPRKRADEEPVSEEPPLCGAAADLSLARIVPNSLWAQGLAAGAGLIFSVAIVAAGVQPARMESVLGRGGLALFAPGAGPAARWTASVGLMFVGQLALLVWWIRSHSLKDFDGRYHLWRRVAVAAGLWSFAVATGVHVWGGESLAARLQWRFEDAGTVAWMGPTLLVGVSLVWGLHREMSACRSSLTCVQGASLAGFAYILIALRLVPLPADWRLHTASLLDGIVLGMVWLLATGSMLHARFVVHQNAEPSPMPRWRLRIPRPHFQLFRSRVRPTEGITGPSMAEQDGSLNAKEQGWESRSPAHRVRGAKPQAVPETSVESTQPPVPRQEPARTPPESKGGVELRSPTATPLRTSVHTVEETSAVARRGATQSSHPWDERDEADARAGTGPVPSSTIPSRNIEVPRQNPITDTQLVSEVDADDDQDSDDLAMGGAENRYQGLSKKQRRKLIAKERSQRDR